MHPIKLNDILQLLDLQHVKVRFNLSFGGNWNLIEIFKNIKSNVLLKIQMKTKTFSIVFLILFIIIPSVQSQLLWKISGNGLSKPSYLLGTHHLIEKEKIPSFGSIAACITQTDVVAGEMDMSRMMSMQIKLMKVAIMKDTTMNQLLSNDDYHLVDTRFRELMGTGLDKLGKLKPVMLSTLYELKLYMKEMNIKKEPEALDIAVQNIGKKNKKKIYGLETIDQQIDILFNSKSLKRQAEILVETVRDENKMPESLKQLNAAYLAGDLETISRLAKEDESMTEEDMNIMIYNRNKNWMDQLLKMIPEKSCFIAVGCYHLIDKQGLIQGFRNAGYIVEPVE